MYRIINKDVFRSTIRLPGCVTSHSLGSLDVGPAGWQLLHDATMPWADPGVSTAVRFKVG